jgi:hypothetical protein
MLSVATIAALLGGTVWVDVRPDWSEPTNLYVAVALPSGENKSAVWARVTAPIHELEVELAELAWPGIIEARTRREVADEAASLAKKAAAKAEDRATAERAAVQAAQGAAEIVVPCEPRLVVSDITPERLGALLAEQSGRLALFTAEGGVFGAMAGRYDGTSKGPKAGLDIWLHAHAGEPVRVDRVNRPPDFVDHACLSIGIAVQPEVLSGLFKVPGFKGRGLLGRFLYALPASRMGHRDLSPPAVPVAVVDAYRSEVLALGRMVANLSSPVRLTVSEDALAVLTAFRAEVEPRLRPSGDLRPMSEWAGKLHGAVARLAGLLHVVECLRNGWDAAPIGPETMERAVRLGWYLLVHAMAAHDLMGADEDMDRLRFLVGWLADRGDSLGADRGQPGTVIRRELMFGTSRERIPDADSATLILDKLAGFGYLRKTEARPGKPTVGRPIAGDVYEMHPALRTTQATKATNQMFGPSSVASVVSVAREPEEARGPAPFDQNEGGW